MNTGSLCASAPQRRQPTLGILRRHASAACRGQGSAVHAISRITVRINGALVPVRVNYDGDWDIPFKSRELVRFWLAYSDWDISK